MGGLGSGVVDDPATATTAALPSTCAVWAALAADLPFARWGEVFYDATAAAAVIDRIVHHATIIKTQGESYRLKNRRRDTRDKKRNA